MTLSTLENLTEALRCLPGIGPKSAQRISYHLLQRDRNRAETLGNAILDALKNLQHCQRCNTFTQDEICERCQSTKRNAQQLCIVETPIDMNMVEQSHAYNGLYFILMGRLSPLDGIGPKDIGLERLYTRVKDDQVQEIILATNFTNEGEATAHYITQVLEPLGIHISRIARGVPVGGELEYIDSGTLAQAVRERRTIDEQSENAADAYAGLKKWSNSV